MLALALGACTVLRPVEQFSEAALYADDRAYVALRYEPARMSAGLRADLADAGYVCEPLARGGHVCSKATPAGPGCEDVGTVEVGLDTVRAARARRCGEAPASPP